MEQKMFCWQCQETAGNKGCTVCGVCGKTADVAALQDELVYETKRLSQVTTALRKDGKPVDKDINHLVTVNLFITITNANFDADAIKAAIAKTKTMRGKLATKDTKSTECTLYDSVNCRLLCQKRHLGTPARPWREWSGTVQPQLSPAVRNAPTQ